MEFARLVDVRPLFRLPNLGGATATRRSGCPRVVGLPFQPSGATQLTNVPVAIPWKSSCICQRGLSRRSDANVVDGGWD